jgi:hypothetical protein
LSSTDFSLWVSNSAWLGLFVLGCLFSNAPPNQ